MDTRQYDPRPMQYNMLGQRQAYNLDDLTIQENKYYCLPDLYKRKYFLCEQLKLKMANYVPQTQVQTKINKQIIRGLTGWEKVLQDVKLRAFEQQEFKKLKIARAYDQSRKCKRKIEQRENFKIEIEEFNLLVSKHLSSQVVQLFQSFSSQLKSDQIEQESSLPRKLESLENYIRNVKQLNRVQIEEEESLSSGFVKEQQILTDTSIQQIQECLKKYKKQGHNRYFIYEKLLNEITGDVVRINIERTESTIISISDFGSQQTDKTKLIKSTSTTIDVQQKSQGGDSKKRAEQLVQAYNNIGYNTKYKYDNLNEALLLSVSDDQMIDEAFEKTGVKQQIQFPISWDNIPILDDLLYNTYTDPHLEEEYENYIYHHRGTLEQVLEDAAEAMVDFRDPEKDFSQVQLIDRQSMFRIKFKYLCSKVKNEQQHSIKKETLRDFYCYNNGFIPLNQQKFPGLQDLYGERLNCLSSHYLPTLPYSFKYFMSLYQNNFEAIANALRACLIARNTAVSPTYAVDLWLWFISRGILKSNSRFLFQSSIYVPTSNIRRNRQIEEKETNQNKKDMVLKLYESYSSIVNGYFALPNIDKKNNRRKWKLSRQNDDYYQFNREVGINAPPEGPFGPLCRKVQDLQSSLIPKLQPPKPSRPNPTPTPEQINNSINYSWIERLSFQQGVRELVESKPQSYLIPQAQVEKRLEYVKETAKNDTKEIIKFFQQLQKRTQMPISQQGQVQGYPQPSQNQQIPRPNPNVPPTTYLIQQNSQNPAYQSRISQPPNVTAQIIHPQQQSTILQQQPKPNYPPSIIQTQSSSSSYQVYPGKIEHISQQMFASQKTQQPTGRITQMGQISVQQQSAITTTQQVNKISEIQVEPPSNAISQTVTQVQSNPPPKRGKGKTKATENQATATPSQQATIQDNPEQATPADPSVPTSAKRKKKETKRDKKQEELDHQNALQAEEEEIAQAQAAQSATKKKQKKQKRDKTRFGSQDAEKKNEELMQQENN